MTRFELQCASMIKNIKRSRLQRFFEKDDSKRLSPDMADRIKSILARLHQAETIEDMNIRSYRPHQLKGKQKGVWAVTAKSIWRITFRFEKETASDVNFEDYH